MSIKNTEDCYGNVHQFLHWAIFICFVALMTVGTIMTDMEKSDQKWQLYQLHKSFGLTVFMLILIRIGWRFVNIIPALPTTMPAHEKMLALFIHFALYIVMLMMPISGYIMSIAGGHEIQYFGLFTVPELLGENKSLAHWAEEIHEWTATAIYVLVALHVLGALRHHFLLHDTVLKRMLPNCSKNS